MTVSLCVLVDNQQLSDQQRLKLHTISKPKPKSIVCCTLQIQLSGWRCADPHSQKLSQIIRLSFLVNLTEVVTISGEEESFANNKK